MKQNQYFCNFKYFLVVILIQVFWNLVILILFQFFLLYSNFILSNFVIVIFYNFTSFDRVRLKHYILKIKHDFIHTMHELHLYFSVAKYRH